MFSFHRNAGCLKIMSVSNWVKLIEEAEKTCLIEYGMRKVHYKFSKGEEMVEEYNMETDIINRRMWKNSSKFGGDCHWEMEIGEPAKTKELSLDDVGIKESGSNPYVTRRSTRNALEWRIRNLPYPLSTYSVAVSPDDKCIYVRTTNKKFFKKLTVPELERIGIPPDQNNIEFTHKFNTLIITYQKPPQLITLEKETMEMLKKLPSSEKGKLPCNPS
ncbi:hypothetical protein J437_LFUL001206 [Ladona fulva]|uniref:Protein DPCD n=1 Tax=Ladona fulva TaxID=123851 RepID=A0A8K0JVY7_LADFU|nr:hypothetical protein J437_LFUL001206 [Ladona fulva]